MSGNRTSYINENCELEFGYYYDNACYAKLKSIISFHMVNPVHSVKSNKKKHYGKRFKKNQKKLYGIVFSENCLKNGKAMTH